MTDQSHLKRRDFIKKTSLGGAMAMSIPETIAAVFRQEKTSKIALKENDVILFQGDSITDAGRNKELSEPNNTQALGSGYAYMAGSQLLYQHPGKNLKIFNKGISGNKVHQLAERWEADALSLKPTVLSILIGVNDYWHTLTNNYKGTIEIYRNDFIKLLENTKKQLPELSLIIGEPFALTGIKAVDDSWFPAFDEYRQAARDIADQFDAVFIPYQSIFEKAQKSAPGAYWAYDGVHPSIAGSQLMAHAWLETVK